VAFHFNPLKAELNPVCHLLALLGAHHILHVSRIRVNLTFRGPCIVVYSYIECQRDALFNNNNNYYYYYYLLQLDCYPVAVVILHVYKT